MLGLYLIAAHLVGDYLLQTRWQAAGKFGWTREAVNFRTRHVAAYLLPFVPIALIYGSPLEAFGFLVWLGVLHWFTDAQRILVTPGEWLVWKLETRALDRKYLAKPSKIPLESMPPNPWPSLPLAVDQTLHILQLTVLGWWFLT